MDTNSHLSAAWPTGAPTWNLAVIISTFVITYYSITSVQAYWRLRHFKGPTLAAWSNLWYVRAVVSGKAHLYMADACRRYGPIVRVGPNTLITCDEELFRKINSVRSGYQKADYYKAFRFDAERENILSETNNDRHLNMRKKVTAGYSGKENPNLEPDMDSVLWSTIILLKSYASKGADLKPLDFARTMQFFTLDVITSIALGQPFGFVTNDKDMYGYIGTMTANFPAMNFMAAVPILSRLMRNHWFQRATLPTVKDKIGMGKIKAVSRDLIAHRFGPKKITREDMTQSFVRHGLTEGEIADESLLQILAGSDTTATILRTGFIYIVSNPRIYNRLQSECDSTDVPLNEIISSARALELPYLTACIKETLRYHPAASGLNPRTVPPRGDVYNDQFLPPGTVIGVSSWALHRLNTSAYGPDAHVFRPERWLEASPTQLAAMEKAHELVFGYGQYRCLGERIARIELHKTFFELIRRFDFGFLDVMRGENVVGGGEGYGLMDFNINYGIFLQRGLWLRIEERISPQS
ncbi:putative cytochrome p450 [Phaeomoniella chlamydospora]|uniref:Putative cytochrome p450 n=1 Tax=Phaeomoniella chlamydospora TaxID=158046 RepID=A0A0G2FZ21_PHACM|nr:putative cytochrome p450 [Phaeomoniella chlamydospora]